MILKTLLSARNKVISTSEELDKAIRESLSETSAGLSVTGDKVLTLTAVFACVRVKAESVAQVPLILYRRREDGGKERAVEHPLYHLLHRQPNPWQTSFEWREIMQGHLDLRGNAYSFKNVLNTGRNAGRVVELLPIHPDRVEVKQDEQFNITYNIKMGDGSLRTFTPKEILHLRGLGSDGVQGYSRIRLFRETFGLALATEKHGAKLFSNGARVGGVFQHPKHLSDEAAERLKKDIETNYSGVENAFRTLVLEEGMEWKAVGLSNEDAQFLDTRRFQVGEIARIWRMPPHMIGDLSRSTNNNIEQQSLEFVKYTMMPEYTRWEQTLTASLLSRADIDNGYFFEFLVDGLLRGDMKARSQFYKDGRQWGWFNADEIRSKENMNPLPDGEGQIYLSPSNMVPAWQVADPDDNDNAQPGGPSDANE